MFNEALDLKVKICFLFFLCGEREITVNFDDLKLSLQKIHV